MKKIVKRSLEPEDLIDKDLVDVIMGVPKAADDNTFPDVNKITVGDTTFTLMPFSNGEEVVRLTSRQMQFLNTLLATLNPYQAAKDAGVKLASARRWFRNKQFRKYFEERKLERAHAQGLTMDFINKKLYDVIRGAEKLDRSQTKCLELAMKQNGQLEKQKPSPFSEADEFIFIAKKGNPSMPTTADGRIIRGELGNGEA